MAKHQSKSGAEVLEESEDDSPAAVTAGSQGAMTGQIMASGSGPRQSAERLGGTLAAGDVLEDALKQDQVSAHPLSITPPSS